MLTADPKPRLTTYPVSLADLASDPSCRSRGAAEVRHARMSRSDEHLSWEGQMVDDVDVDEGRVEFGTDLNAALRHWGGYAEFPEGFEHADAVLRVLSSVLGDIASCYALKSKRYVGVRLSRMPSNAAQVSWGYVGVTQAALTTAEGIGVDLRQQLSAEGLRIEDGPRDDVTVWNSQGLRDRSRATHAAEVPRRLCPTCFLQWAGDTCPDCEVELLPPSTV